MVTLVLNDADGAVNEPLISVAICADDDTKVFTVTTSLAVTLVLNDADSVVNAPLISVAICADDDTVPDGTVLETPVRPLPSPTKLPLNTEPLIVVAFVKSTIELLTVNEPVICKLFVVF